jgi:hypothetical protein
MTSKQKLTQEEICPICLRHNSFDKLMCADCVRAFDKGRQSRDDEVRKIIERLKKEQKEHNKFAGINHDKQPYVEKCLTCACIESHLEFLKELKL